MKSQMNTQPLDEGARKRLRTQEPDVQADGANSTPARQTDHPDSRGGVTPKRVACTHCRQSKVCNVIFSWKNYDQSLLRLSASEGTKADVITVEM